MALVDYLTDLLVAESAGTWRGRYRDAVASRTAETGEGGAAVSGREVPYRVGRK
jgi:hypothetical protein